MSSNRFLLAAAVGGVVVFLVGGVFYGWLLADFFAANQGSAIGAMREPADVDYVHLFLGQMVLGAFLAVVIDKWAGVGGVVPGLKIGAISGLMIALGYDLTLFGVTNMANITSTLVDPLVALVQMACAGAAIGAIVGERK
jgi:hypothetical protein